MALQLLLSCACLATLIVPSGLGHVHEARQGPISTDGLSPGGPNSPQTSSFASTLSDATTMPPTTTRTSTSSSSSRTSSATPQSSSSPASLSITVKNLTTCTSGLISWNYSGGAAESLSLSIAASSPNQDYVLSRLRARESTVNSTIQLANTQTSALSWTWSSVNVAQGWYEIQGLVLTTPNISNNSSPFFISNGTDVACLSGTSASASASAVPSSAASTTNIAGIVGGTVGAAVVVIAGIFLWLWKRKKRFFGGGKGDRKWGSIRSTNSSIQPEGSGAQLTGGRFHTHSDSTAGILQDVAGGTLTAAALPGDSDEDGVIVGEEKLVSPASSSGANPFDTLNTPVRYERRVSTNSIQTPTTTASEASRFRAASLRVPNQSLEQQAQRIRSSMETSNRPRGERLSMPTLPSPSLFRHPHSPTHIQSKEEYALSPVTATPVDRSISTGAVSVVARRASRKPVPHYDSSVLLEDTNGDSVSTFTTAGAESSQSHGTGMGAGAYGTPAGLVHKTSFGDGRPVHYLMPDMPPPQRD